MAWMREARHFASTPMFALRMSAEAPWAASIPRLATGRRATTAACARRPIAVNQEFVWVAIQSSAPRRTPVTIPGRAPPPPESALLRLRSQMAQHAMMETPAPRRTPVSRGSASPAGREMRTRMVIPTRCAAGMTAMIRIRSSGSHPSRSPIST